MTEISKKQFYPVHLGRLLNSSLQGERHFKTSCIY